MKPKKPGLLWLAMILMLAPTRAWADHWDSGPGHHDSYRRDPLATPEPSTVYMMIGGLVLVGLTVARRRK